MPNCKEMAGVFFGRGGNNTSFVFQRTDTELRYTHSYPLQDMNAVQNSFPHHHKSQQQKNKLGCGRPPPEWSRPPTGTTEGHVRGECECAPRSANACLSQHRRTSWVLFIHVRPRRHRLSPERTGSPPPPGWAAALGFYARTH